MSDTNAPVVVDADVKGGEPCIAGTRIPVRAIVSFAREGVAGIKRAYPHLSDRQIADALAWSIAAQPAPQADEWTADGLHRPTLERAAGVCENRASVIRMAGITENMDPLEVELLDREHTRTEHAIRALAKKADHGE